MEYYPNNGAVNETGGGYRPVYSAPADPAREERRSVRRIANAVGGALLIQSGLTLFIQVAFFFVLGLMGKSASEAQAFFYDPRVIWPYQAIVSTIMMTLPFFIATRFGRTKVAAVARFGKPERGTLWPLFLFGVWITAAANIANSMFLSVVEYEQIEMEHFFGAYPQGVFGTALVTLAIAAVPALVEEFAFRGVALGMLRKVSDGFAIVVSALLFSLMHANITQMPFTFLLGLYLGYMTVVSGSVWPAVLLHFFNNLLSVAIEYLGIYFSDSAVSIANDVYLIAAPVLGLLGFVLMCAGKGGKFFIRKSDCVNRFGARLRMVLTSPCIIIYIIYVIIEILLIEVQR